MRIDVWSDVVCPWCWIGKVRLQKALAGFPAGGEVEVVFRSFQLDPNTPKDLDIPSDEMLARKYRIGPVEVRDIHARLEGLGKAEGIDFRFELSRTANTFDAHQLIHLAKEKGLQMAMADRLFRAQFSEGIRVGDRKELLRLATEVGLDAGEVGASLDRQGYASAVREDEAQAKALGITGVPFFLFNGEVGVSGAQPVSVLRRVMEEA